MTRVAIGADAVYKVFKLLHQNRPFEKIHATLLTEY